jgi:hypothetical protein
MGRGGTRKQIHGPRRGFNSLLFRRGALPLEVAPPPRAAQLKAGLKSDFDQVPMVLDAR